MDSTEPMRLHRNLGNGRFSDVTSPAQLLSQLGGLYCVQTDYNNDGCLDLFISRGAWFLSPIRPSLLRNEGDGTWTDVTQEVGLLDPVNSNSATWSDYDNDGNLDLFICSERSHNRLYHNSGADSFTEVSAVAGVKSTGSEFCKGATWIDFDNDNAPDLYVNNLQGDPRLYHNQRDGTFLDATSTMGIDGPQQGFACWTWDYNNDGWLDIFATSYQRSVTEVVQGMTNRSTSTTSGRLWLNVQGQRFEDRSIEAGVNATYETMGCNFGDLDNDGWLDFY